MSDILTTTLNPALDVATTTPRVVPGPKLRCTQPLTDPGGGGINVARAVLQLGGQATAFVALGGHTGQRVEMLIRELGLAVMPFGVSGETRQSLSVRDDSIAKQYRFVMPGPTWEKENENQALDAIGGVGDGFRYVVVSGSQPPGVSDGFLHALAERLQGQRASLIADTSGPPLHRLVAEPMNIAVLRMDSSEAEDLAGHALTSVDENADFARALVAKGAARMVIVACGPLGSVLATEEACYHAACPVDRVESAVGAGDSFVGAFTLALSQDLPAQTALCHGTAAASAALLTPGTTLCRKEDTRKMLEICTLTVL